MTDYLKYKEESILTIYNAIINELGIDYFEKLTFGIATIMQLA